MKTKTANGICWTCLLGAFVLTLLALWLLTGCSTAHFTVTETGTNGVVKTTEATVNTFFNGNSEVAKIQLVQGMKSKEQGISVGTVAENQPATNLVPIFQALFEAAFRAALMAAKP